LRAIVILVAVALVSCTSTPRSAASTPSPRSPSPVVLNPDDSKAADFRTRLDLLLGEHVMAIAKESSAAGRTDEYTSYLHLLTANGNDLTELVRSALGDTAASNFDQIWRDQNDYWVNYTIALVTHNQDKATQMMVNLMLGHVRDFSLFFVDAVSPAPSTAVDMQEQVIEMKAMIDDQIAQNYPKMYADLRKAYAHASLIGDDLAPAITKKFPDKFPGNASSPAADLRASLDSQLQEHQYLATMATGATTAGRTAERAAAATALADNGHAQGALFNGLFGASTGTRLGHIWDAMNAAMIAYASASTSASKQTALSQLNDTFVTQISSFVQDSTGLTASRPPIAAQVEAAITVIDDQKSKAWARLGPDDRSAEAAMEAVADLITSAIITRLPARFAA
jgi:hypothetical protein